MKKSIILLATLLLTTLFAGCEWTHGNNEKPVINPNLVEVEAETLIGDYYGKISNNIRFYLSTKGLNEDGSFMPHGTYYIVELTATVYGTSNATVQLPRGSYTLGKEISAESSKYVATDYSGEVYKEKPFDTASLCVDLDGIILEVTMGEETHVVKYSGSPRIRNMGENGKHSTLTEGLMLNFEDHTLYYAPYGDYYNTGVENWMLLLWPNSDEGDIVQFDIMTTKEPSNTLLGTYIAAASASSEWSFIVGSLAISDASNTMEGSWYYTSDYTDRAPFVGGELKLEDGGDGTTKMSFYVFDDRNNHIKGEWCGTMIESSAY